MQAKIAIMLTIALLCGGGAILSVRGILADQQAAIEAVVPAAPVVTQTIVVARQPIGFGTELSADTLATVAWPADAVPAGAFTSIAEIVSGEPRTVLFPIEANEMVLASKITGPGERASLSRLVSPGRRAVSLRVNDIAGVAGFVLPGDSVDVLLTVPMDGGGARAEVVLQDVRVLSVDQTADQRTATPVVARAVTVEVDPEAAQKIVLAQSIGTLSLILRRTGDDRTVDSASMTEADVVGSEADGLAAAPIVEAVADETATVAEPPRATVAVTRALQRTEYQVPVFGSVDLGGLVSLATGQGNVQ